MPSATFENQTLRQVVHVSIGGARVRVRLSNEYGDTPLEIGEAHLARHAGGSSIVPFSDRTLTFDGESAVSIPAGEEVLSDPVILPFAARSELAVTTYFPESTGLATWHEFGQQTAFVSPAGNFAGAAELPAESTTTAARHFLTGVDVDVLRPAHSTVVFGDSIADGFASAVDENQRWPDLLSERLNPGLLGLVGVLNQGVSGNRVLSALMRESGTARFERDALAQPGVEHLVLIMGVNDIGFPGAFPFLPPDQQVEATDIIAGLESLVERAHDEGLAVYGGTLTPFEGTTLPGYFTLEGEVKRQEVNAWIRSSGTFDAVFDFDALLQDPAQPTRLLPEFDSGDGLHPSDAAHQAMADSIDLSLFF